MAARDHITLGFAVDGQQQRANSSRSGFAVDNRDWNTPFGTFNDQGKGQGEQDKATGSTLSGGGKVLLHADQGDINILGSTVVAQNQLALDAGRHINILSTQSSRSQSEQQVSSGIGSAQISDTEYFSGWMKNRRDSNSNEVEQVRSQVGSLSGNVDIRAAGRYTQQAANVNAAQDLSIRAAGIDVLAAQNSGSSHQAERDVKIGSFAKVSSPLIDLVNTAEGAAKSKADDRVRALQGMATVAQGYQLYDAVKNQGSLAKVEAGVGFKTSNSSQNQSYSDSQRNTLAAGGNLKLQSTEGDIRLQHTAATAGKQLSLNAAQNIVLESGQSSRHNDGKNSSTGAQVGVGASVGAQTGLYIYAEAGASKGSHQLDANRHQHTTLAADHIQLSSGGDTILKGATATANRIDADVKGKLHIESVQDTLSQQSKQSGGGVRVQVSLGTAWEASGNFSQNQGNGERVAVNQQSGLFAGEGGYHIQADSVHLVGGAIASTATKENNELTTHSLAWENIENRSSYSASSVSLSGGYGSNSPSKNPANTAFRESELGKAFARSAGKTGPSFTPGLPQYESDSEQSTTYATLSEGRLNIGGKATTTAELGIHSDAATAHQRLSELPDIQQVLQKQQAVAAATADITAAVRTFSGNMAKQKQQEQQQAFEQLQTAIANNDAAQIEAAAQRYDQAEQAAKEWGIGGGKARALNAATIVVTGALGGQTDLQIATNTLAPYAAETIGKTFGQNGSDPNEAAQLLSHALLAGFVAAGNGGDFGVGAAAGAGAEAAAKAITIGLYGQEAASNPNLLSEEQKTVVRDLSAAVGTLVGGVGGDSALNAQLGGVLGQNAVENNWLSAIQLMDIEKAYLACKGNAVCEQKVKDSANALSQLQDTQLTWAKAKCLIGDCEDYKIIKRQVAHSGNISLVYRELAERYPNASDAELKAAAQIYSREAYDSYEKGTGRFIIGALDTLPAVGLAGKSVSQGARGVVNIVKQSALKSASSREVAEQIAKHPLLDDAIARSGTSARPVVNQGNVPTCGHNCAALILNQEGKAVDVSNLIKSMAPTTEGITGNQVAILFKRNGINAQFVERRNIDDIVRYTQNGQSVIVRIKKDKFSHFIIVDGVTKRNGINVVAVRDPHGIQYFSPVNTFKQSFTGEVIFTKPR